MTHEMKLKEIYFNKIKNGSKIYEIRLNDEKRQLIDVGDVIIFKNASDFNQTLKSIIVDLIYFDNFEEMATTLPKEKVGFENENTSKIVEIYHQFYSIEDEKKYGIVAIKIELAKEGSFTCNN